MDGDGLSLGLAEQYAGEIIRIGKEDSAERTDNSAAGEIHCSTGSDASARFRPRPAIPFLRVAMLPC